MLLDDLHSLVDSTTVDRKIAESIRFHRQQRLWTSERTFQFQLTQGKESYALGDGPPPDLVEIVSRKLYILIGGDSNQRLPCLRVPSLQFDGMRMFGVVQSQPEYWDFYGQKMRFYPSPISSTDVVEGRYVSDLGVPVVRYNSVNSTYEFYWPPDGQRLMSATELTNFENDWTDMGASGAGHMVKARAAYLLYSQVLKDPDSADSWLNSWLEQKGMLEEETEDRTAGATEIAGRIID
jgi:hypothetical protein